jgi:large subunit ribosomal protein L1
MSVSLETIRTAVKNAKENAPERKFQESFDIIINIKDLDLSNPANRFDLEVNLPNPMSKKASVCVIGEGDLAVRAERAEADRILGREDLEQLAGNPKMAKEVADAHYFFVAAAPMMPLVGRFLGRILGPRGKMPSPIPPNIDIAPIITRLRQSTRVRLRQNPTIHTRVGTADMSDEELSENVQAVLTNILDRFERGSNNLRSIFVKTTMGQSVKVL